MAKQHIVVIEDDPDIQSEMEECLGGEGYRVTSVVSAELAEEAVRTNPADLIILDIGLPGTDGLTYSREVRGKSEVGVILVTGRVDEFDRVLGLEVGADDYICKPFSLRELLARVRSVLRRTAGKRYPPDARSIEAALVFGFADWRLNTFTRELVDPAGAAVHLTTAEYELLRTFVEGANRVYSRDYLSYEVFGREASPVSRAVDGLVSRLRSKLEAGSDGVDFIKTVRGAGYIFAQKVRLVTEE